MNIQNSHSTHAKQSPPQSLRVEFAKALKQQDLSDRTVEAYIAAMKQFCAFSKIHPLRAGINEIRAFLYYIRFEKGSAPRTYNQIMYGIRAFYLVFCPDIPILTVCIRHKTNRRKIIILDREEVSKMIQVTTNLKHRAIIATLYGSGIRVNECTIITFKDIDRKNMLLHIVGKGDADRFTILSRTALILLEQYYHRFRPKTYVFEGRTPGKPITTHMIEIAVRNAAEKARIPKKVTPHILRHSIATHLLEDGYDIATVQRLLGHKHIKTTSRYEHLRTDYLKRVKSPLDTTTIASSLRKGDHDEKK